MVIETAQPASQPTKAESEEALESLGAVRRAVAVGVESVAKGAADVQEQCGIDNRTFSLRRLPQKSRDAKTQAAANGKPRRKPN